MSIIGDPIIPPRPWWLWVFAPCAGVLATAALYVWLTNDHAPPPARPAPVPELQAITPEGVRVYWVSNARVVVVVSPTGDVGVAMR